MLLHCFPQSPIPWIVHSIPLALPDTLPSPFSLFLDHLWLLFCSYSHSPQFYIPIHFFPKPPHPLDDPSHPHFRFLKTFMDAFLQTFLFYSIHIWFLALNREYLTTFCECNKLPWKEKWIAILGRKKAPKKRPNIHTYSLVHTKGILYNRHAAERPCGSICTATRKSGR